MVDVGWFSQTNLWYLITNTVTAATNGLSGGGGSGSGFPLAANGNANQHQITNLWALSFFTNSGGSELWTGLRPTLYRSNPTIETFIGGDSLAVALKSEMLFVAGNGNASSGVLVVTNAGVSTSISSNAIVTGSITVATLTNSGDFSVTGNTTNFGIVKVVGNQTNVANFSVTGNQTNFASLYLKAAAAQSGKTNMLMADTNGKVVTNDFAAFVASLGAGIPQSPWAQDIDAAGFSIGGGGGFIFTGNSTNGGNFRIGGNLTNSGNLSVLLTQTNFGAVVQKSGVTNETLTASTVVTANTNKKYTSLANAAGALTNDASGGLGYDNTFAHTNQLVSWAGALNSGQYLILNASLEPTNTLNGSGWTNLVIHTHEGTTTNITITFNGAAPQLFTCTNGPSIGQDYFIHWAGGNGSASIRFVGSSYNRIHFDYDPTWLSGSNSVVTNGTLSFTSYGGTNAAQIVAAMKEKQ